MTRLLFLAATLALGGCGLAQSLVVDVLYDEAELPADLVRRDLAYLPEPAPSDAGGDPKHRLDLFLPLADSLRAGPWPVVVFVHGGGWTEGDRDFTFGGEDLYGNVGRYFAGRGVGTAVVSYRLLPDVEWRAQVADVAAALAFVQDTVAAFGGDPASVVLMGHSAGAQLAAHVAYDPDARRAAGAAPVCGLVSVSGAALDLVDPATWETGTAFDYYSTLFSPTRAAVAEPPAEPFGWQLEASPVTAVSPDDPPTLIVYADGEDALFETQAAALARALRAAAVPHSTVVMPALTHEAGVFNLSHPGRVVGPETLRFVRERNC